MSSEVTVMFGRSMASFNESDGVYRMCVVKDRVTARRVTITLSDMPETAGRDEGEGSNIVIFDITPLCAV